LQRNVLVREMSEYKSAMANHNSHRQRHSIHKGWIIGLEAPDFSMALSGCLAVARRGKPRRFTYQKKENLRMDLHPTLARSEGAPDQTGATTQVKRVCISGPFRANHLFGWFPGLKPRAESYSPFGAKTIPNSA
jgi:hypothetical protein